MNTAISNYRVFEETKYIEDRGEITVYGVEFLGNAATGEDGIRISDVSSKIEIAEKLAGICNNLGVSREHFFDVTRDFLESNEF